MVLTVGRPQTERFIEGLRPVEPPNQALVGGKGAGVPKDPTRLGETIELLPRPGGNVHDLNRPKTMHPDRFEPVQVGPITTQGGGSKVLPRIRFIRELEHLTIGHAKVLPCVSAGAVPMHRTEKLDSRGL
jgi:hypothetical protein